MQGIWVRSLVCKDPTRQGAAKPVRHNDWSPFYRTCALRQRVAPARHKQRKPTHSNEDPSQLEKKKKDAYYLGPYHILLPDCITSPYSPESTCNAGDPGSIPGLGWSPGEGKGYPFWPGEFHELYSPCSPEESDTTERLSLSLSLTRAGGTALETPAYCISPFSDKLTESLFLLLHNSVCILLFGISAQIA